ncbi:MAG: EAL domain-containing protein, partial [Lachnospiraceae bacterium]|nr:EAL domain-containing protein [Lachnospiraceae bacterium]
KVYAQVPHVIIRKRGDRTEELQTLAVTGDNLTEEGGVSFGEEAELLILEDQRECLQAVRSGRASAALCDGYMAEYLLGSQLGFGQLEIHTVLSDVHSIRMVVRDDADSPLLGILNKELPDVTDKMVNDYMLQDNFYSRMSVDSFIRDHSIVIILILFSAAALAIFVLYRMLENSRRLQKLMYRDTDFNIWNLNYLKYRASLRLGTEADRKYAIVYTDICQFKSYNALYGWSTGQRLLELTIEELSSEIDSERELYARSYGSHFVLFVCYEDMAQLEERIQDMADRISGYIYEKEEIRMTQALGICAISEGETDIQLALSNAIQTVDLIKDSHSNVVRVYDDELRKQLKEQQERETLLDSADVQRDFVAYYQAKVDIRSERVVGAEALVRFKDPSAGGAIRAPGFFVPYYEQTGRITEIDFFVMESVCKMLRRRLDQGLSVVPVSCNFSRSHFVREGFPAHIEAVMEKYQIPKNLIEVEITETLVVEEMQQQKVKENVEILRRNGIHLSIDDFGSGYSSLGVFEQIPASVIKLDRSFLLNNENRTRQVQIMKNIVNLAKDLDAQVVCEG